MAATMTSEDASAIIDNALLGANATTPSPATGESGGMPGPLPTEAETPDEANLTPEQKKEREEQEKIRQAQADMLGEEQAAALAEEQRRQEEREKTLLGAAERVFNSGKNAASRANIKIGNIPTPGNLVVPLILLAAFFFILITYNGHTRLQWGWLVLTNNASVTGTDQGSGTGGGPPNPAQETAISLPPAYTGSGMYGSPYS